MQMIPNKRIVFPRLIRSFIAMESSGGIVMLLFAALAVILANSPLSDWYKAFISLPVTFGYADTAATEPLKEWVKDILMVLFFLVVGMELKREIREGVLSSRDQVMLPLVAAAGGMAAPAAIFYAINHAYPENLAGWAIPSATDIAFAMCVVTLLGRKVPPVVKIFLLAIAIFDDLGAILIIAAFYNTELALIPLLLALAGIAGLALLNRRGVAMLLPYLLTGVFLWFCFYHSGIHTTIAGVAVGMAIPMRHPKDPRHSPLNAAIHMLHPWVSFIVLPVFAFTSAGVSLVGMGWKSFLEPLPLGIALGLFFGKQIGILGVTWALVKLRLVRKPEGAGWRHLYGASVLAGIGFTMSLFIGMLAFSEAHMEEMVKAGVIGGSLLSTMWGFAVLNWPGSRGAIERERAV